MKDDKAKFRITILTPRQTAGHILIFDLFKNKYLRKAIKELLQEYPYWTSYQITRIDDDYNNS